MKKLFFLIAIAFCSLLFASTASAQCQGNVYYTSFTWQTTNAVHGYSSTYLDYCGGLYYDPAIAANFRENQVSLIGQGYTQGYADSYPAELSFDFLAPIHTANYTTQGDHFVIAYYLVYVPYWNSYGWYDPWNFGFSEIGGGNEAYYDYGGYWGYETYWVSSPQYVDTTSDTIAYHGPPCECQPGQQFTSCGPCPTSTPNECQPGQQFTPSGQPCPGFVPPVEPPEQPIVSVAVVGSPIFPAGLPAKLSKPQPPRNTPAAACITGVSNPGGRNVTLQLVNDSINSGADGGHIESLHLPGRPLGKLGRSNGTTRPDGCFLTNYTPPHISGKFKLKATISGNSSETDIWVLVPGLEQLLPGENYRLNGGIVDCNVPDDSCTPTIGRQAHPSNHWVVPGAKAALVKTADDYKTRFYGSGVIPVADMITYNDASLIGGGKFDLFRNWATENENHGEHREGLSIDTREKNILKERQDEFIQIFFRNNFGFNDERGGDASHFHLRWADLRFTGIPGSLQNGIDHNAFAYDPITESPSTFVDNVSWAIFERETTQAEYESWLPQLSNAKAQGQNVFLQEVKTFEKQLFASQEYISRQRTNEQFVQDVFASHLSRDPTAAELSYWMGYLADIGGTQPIDPVDTESGRGRTTVPISQTQRRQIFLTNFEELPAFVIRVASVVDDTYQEPPH